MNLTGPFLCTQAVLPSMLAQGRGKVVNVASTTGILALTKRSAYAASKAGLIGLTKALAYELSAQGIWVNAIAPGPTETPMNAPYFEDPDMRATLQKEIPLGRWGQPDEIAAAILFLASDESDYVQRSRPRGRRRLAQRQGLLRNRTRSRRSSRAVGRA